tara:strand:+ start:1229 stop:2440 length:1212 start_codon:yes stop_codon:yes gene_type:complete
VFPYKGIGGVPVVFSLIAEDIAKRYGHEVYVVDYKDGAISNQIDKNVCNFIEYSDKEKRTLPKNSYIVFQAMTPWSIFSNLEIDETSKLYFWVLHFSNFLPLIPGLRRYMQSNILIFSLLARTFLFPWYQKSRNFVKYLFDNNALAFMDKDCFGITSEFLDIKLSSPLFIPLPIECRKNYFKPVKSSRKKLKFIFLGRLVNFKFYTLKLAIKKLKTYVQKNKIQADFTIIGNGPYKNKLCELVENFNDINFIFISKIPYLEINDFLRGNFDIAFVMGSAALKCVSQGIPAILLDQSYRDVQDNYNFTWLHNRDGYSLGDHLNKKNFCNNNESLYKCINDYLENPELISKLSYQYLIENHSLEKVSNLFLKNLKLSKMNKNSYVKSKYFRKGIIYSLYKKLFKK